jgi:hypothetical protein
LRQELVVLLVALLGKLVVDRQQRRWLCLHRRSWSLWDRVEQSEE